VKNTKKKLSESTATTMVAMTLLSLGADPLYSTSVASQTWGTQYTSTVNRTLSATRSLLSPITAKEIVSWLHNEGLPMSAIAEISRVQRKSVYAWINGKDIRPLNQKRLEILYTLLSKDKIADLLSLYRTWDRSLKGGKPLHNLLKQNTLDSSAISAALSELWPVAKQIQKQMVIAKNIMNKNQTVLGMLAK